MKITAQTRIGDLVLEYPAAMRLFESLNLDYCCGGHRSLSEAAELAGQPIETVLLGLTGLDSAAPTLADPKIWLGAPLTTLIAHLEATHHVFTRSELARVAPLMERVLKVHGEHHPELARIAQCLEAARADLLPHLEAEETQLFPYLRALEAGTAGQGGLEPIATLQAEHEALGDLLRELKTLTQDYTPPADACGSFRSLYMGLQSLEADLHLHIYLESHLLFPRALEMAAV